MSWGLKDEPEVPGRQGTGPEAMVVAWSRAGKALGKMRAHALSPELGGQVGWVGEEAVGVRGAQGDLAPSSAVVLGIYRRGID